MIDEQLRQQLRDLVERPNARRGLSFLLLQICTSLLIETHGQLRRQLLGIRGERGKIESMIFI